MGEVSNDKYYRWCTYIYVPVQYFGLFFGFWCLAYDQMTTGERAGLSITLGVSGAVAINVAHELGHKKSRIERSLAKLALAQSFYGHFLIEHNVGHHVNVATPDDPASARFGESVWAFFPRAVFGGLASGIRLESARLQRQGERFWGPHNNILHSWLTSLVIYGVILGVFGWRMLPWIALQAVLAVLVLEAVNYIEHYGLLRPLSANGRRTQISSQHSWNGDHLCSNLFLFNLQRHSDHHTYPRRRYQVLRSLDDAPQLPVGYALMVLLSLAPPLWRRVMDPRVLAHYDGDLTKINIQPSRRDKIVRKYGPLSASLDPDDGRGSSAD
ncbi:alkane 1-monooxygenase [Tomitella biformata]|uniref:alkane 1-monooxygenase n=1 Tax=Tomitella biformata TaxID=630403 RepID=UPI0027DC3D9C|nr:alkane 1-monooxygenase [Tomitella biformata]